MKMVDVHEFLDLLSSSFGLPMLKCELHIILTKYQKRGRINIESFIENFENIHGSTINKNDEKKILLIKDSENFGKTLFKKLCKLRSNDSNKTEFRKVLLSDDLEQNGFISKKKLQRILDRLLDLTDAEGALLIENLTFTDNTKKNEIDYSLLLLLLYEPIKRNVHAITAGTAMINKIMRGTDSTALKKLLHTLFRSFADADPKALGVVPFITADKILKKECSNVDMKFLGQILETFKELRSDCVLYPEMICFLGNCSLWNVMHRINQIDHIRQKQGYNFTDYLKNYVSKKGQKIDSARLFEQFLGIGILLPETGMHTIFTNYGGKENNGNSNNLDVNVFVDAVAQSDANNDIENSEGDVTAKIVRNDIVPYKG